MSRTCLRLETATELFGRAYFRVLEGCKTSLTSNILPLFVLLGSWVLLPEATAGIKRKTIAFSVFALK